MNRGRPLAYVLMLCVTIKQLLSHEYTPFDRLIEAAVLLVITGDVIVRAVLWYRKHKLEQGEYENDAAAKLAAMTPDESDALWSLILRGKQPPDNLATPLSIKLHPIMTRDYNVGWQIDRDYKDYMKRWAKGKDKR